MKKETKQEIILITIIIILLFFMVGCGVYHIRESHKEFIERLEYNGTGLFISLVEAQYLNVEDIIRLEEYVQQEEDYEN